MTASDCYNLHRCEQATPPLVDCFHQFKTVLFAMFISNLLSDRLFSSSCAVSSRAISKFESYAGHSGAPRSGEPGIHNHWQRAMDSGLATFGGAPE